ncbi:MAG TPA: hypothetical protein VIM65_22390 [Cyclobacteriaceae bacterium]
MNGYLKLTLSILLTTLLYSSSLACVCGGFTNDYIGELHTYDFVALVEIEQIDTVSYHDFAHLARIKILELFKGDIDNSIIIEGGHPSMGISTSCDLGDNIGEQWIIFAYKVNNRLVTHSCTYSTRYRNRDGLRYPVSEHGANVSMLEDLQKFFKHKVFHTYKGPYTDYYTNGNKEVEAFYKKGRLHGERKIWFPTGTLRSVEQYRNGKLHGVCKMWHPNRTQAILSHYKKGDEHGAYAWWNEKGELKTLNKFSHGERIDTATSWYETITDTSQIDEFTFIWNGIPPVTYDSARKILATRQIMDQTIFDKHGRRISEMWWHRTGIPKSIKSWYEKESYTICVDFDEAGAVSMITILDNRKDRASLVYKRQQLYSKP